MKDTPCFGFKLGVVGRCETLDNLRLEINTNRFHVLSYHHMDSFEFESANGKDTITASFYHHRVRIAGRNLRKLGAELQIRTVEFIKAIPTRYGMGVDDETGFVESIEVETIKAE